MMKHGKWWNIVNDETWKMMKHGKWWNIDTDETWILVNIWLLWTHGTFLITPSSNACSERDIPYRKQTSTHDDKGLLWIVPVRSTPTCLWAFNLIDLLKWADPVKYSRAQGSSQYGTTIMSSLRYCVYVCVRACVHVCVYVCVCVRLWVNKNMYMVCMS